MSPQECDCYPGEGGPRLCLRLFLRRLRVTLCNSLQIKPLWFKYELKKLNNKYELNKCIPIVYSFK